MTKFDSSCSSFETKDLYNSLEVVDTGKFAEMIFFDHTFAVGFTNSVADEISSHNN